MSDSADLAKECRDEVLRVPGVLAQKVAPEAGFEPATK